MIFKSRKRKALAHSNTELDRKRILSEDTPFAITEAYRALYTNILYLPIEGKTKKLAIFSAVPGEGKTTVSINLAYTIASNSSESRVVIVDADMRKPRVAKLMGFRSRKISGLSEYLAGIDDEINLLDTKYENLKFVSSGAINANSPALLSAVKMKKFVSELEEKFDYIIFDTPPVNLVSDTLMLSDYVHGYIMAVKSEFSDYNAVTEAIKRIEASESKLFGFVLSAYNMKSAAKRGNGFYKYNYNYKYSNYTTTTDQDEEDGD